MQGYERSLKMLDPRAVGISKISVQTGTSHAASSCRTGRLSR